MAQAPSHCEPLALTILVDSSGAFSMGARCEWLRFYLAGLLCELCHQLACTPPSSLKLALGNDASAGGWLKLQVTVSQVFCNDRSLISWHVRVLPIPLLSRPLWTTMLVLGDGSNFSSP